MQTISLRKRAFFDLLHGCNQEMLQENMGTIDVEQIWKTSSFILSDSHLECRLPNGDVLVWDSEQRAWDDGNC
jgi:hypothetical protein